jgi:hypothetical protein
MQMRYEFSTQIKSKQIPYSRSFALYQVRVAPRDSKIEPTNLFTILLLFLYRYCLCFAIYVDDYYKKVVPYDERYYLRTKQILEVRKKTLTILAIGLASCFGGIGFPS